ncbi:aspartyl/asparaginyl beta-hydroxylase domain-containing protein [Pseudomonas fluorescens]|uniref:aspartyl/asparaginyl beta-hydroxylase domain-containing protein n=1 Tax=Pseudomonas fluorescens group TaxID=136843 RepID=UPI00177B80A7|nr:MULTISPECIES: aspartyl/asparaginyl beta-hydroxylase domain-containing protein [Pseudomonas fluorescens group]MBD8146581.1 aspartyl/asparaginyl beta-hydroxylase domain-containing protein [Pseudomonas fluorescens]MBD8175025.1 aspartyl/asparaginyl beta-hydroxylase domain-containing protein [Pseudomonas fluorescens]MBD8743481.1 aspartyl/asparaginyl beta-hydroxylase domain-containing protein [Pseudomonas fluorescens]MBD8752912.1 aspartyl/asparaginyl beta-hydroxylase domain-containing protein [Pse
MSKNAVGKKLISLVWVIGVLLFMDVFPHISLVFLLLVLFCGIYDFLRNGLYDRDTIKKYFVGNGRNTWILAPFNTLFDLLSRRNRHVYTMQDLPPAWREDLQQVIDDAMARKEEIIDYLDARMAEKKRGMLFFQWYGRPIETALDIPQLRKKLPFVKTIGVSVFNENRSTSFHFGPLRMMFRVLYNMAPAPHHEGVYIQVGKHKHYWHDDPLFIFDDTLMHASFNKNDAKRYCLFIDIVRPTLLPSVLNAVIAGFAGLVFTLRRVFYKNWKLIQ